MTDLNGYIANSRPKEVHYDCVVPHKTKHVAETRSRRLVRSSRSRCRARSHCWQMSTAGPSSDLYCEGSGGGDRPSAETLLSAVALALEGAVYAPTNGYPANMYLLERGLVCFGGQVWHREGHGVRSDLYRWQPHGRHAL